MNNIVKAMQHLNNAEKRAVRAHKTLTHAFFCLPHTGTMSYNETRDILLNHRWFLLNELPDNSRYKAKNIANDIERDNYVRWINEAKAAGLR